MLWQKNAWVDTTTMLEIARNFVEVKKNRLGDKWALMTLENLGAHCATEVK